MSQRTSRTLAPLIAATIAVATLGAAPPAVANTAAETTLSTSTNSGATIERIESDDPRLEYDGAWRSMRGGDSGGELMYLNSPGSVTLAFEGTGVAWISRLTSSSGIGRVMIDGIEVAEIDRYSPHAMYQQTVFETSGLSDGPHEITIEWTGQRNSDSAGRNLLIDAIDIVTAVPAVQDVMVAPITSGYSVSWAPPPGAVEVEGWRVIRTRAGESTVVGTTPAGVRLLRDETAQLGVDYTYRVEAVSASVATAASSPVAAPAESEATRAILDSQVCPEPTTTVSNEEELQSALDRAGPGTVIWLENGYYDGQFTMSNVDGGAERIWICGTSYAVLTTGLLGEGHALLMKNVAGVTVHGITLKRSLKGVTVISSDDVILRDIVVKEIGYEGIHLRTQTTNSYLIGARVRSTGLLKARYGEGLYIGTSSGNVCSQNDCHPDATAVIGVIDNRFTETGAQAIEVKEGSAGGVITGNEVIGATWMDDYSKGLILLKGTDWWASNNTVTAVAGYGLANIFSRDGSGADNVFAGNHVSGSADYAVWVHTASWITETAAVWCSNAADGNIEIANVACGR